MSKQGLFQGSQHSQALLAQRREIAPDAAEGHGASRRAETAGDLLLDLHHPDITLREAIAKRHGEMLQEAEHSVLMLGESIQQIARLGLFGPSFLAHLCGRSRWRVGLIALRQQRTIADFPVSYLQRMQTGAPFLSSR